MTAQQTALPTHPRRNPSTAFRRVGDEGGLVVIPGRSEVKVLNPVGIAVFALLDGEHTVDDIVARIQDEFDVTPDAARADVLSFLHDLAAHGMLAETGE